MVFDPLLDVGIAGDLGVEDEKAGFEFGDASANLLAVPFQQQTTIGFRAGSRFAQRRIAQHLAERHAGSLEPAEEIDPGQDRGVVVALA